MILDVDVVVIVAVITLVEGGAGLGKHPLRVRVEAGITVPR